MASDYCIKIRQENDNRLEQSCSWIPHDIFNINLEFRYVSGETGTNLETFHKSIIYPRDMFLSQELGPSLVLSMFSNTTGAYSSEFLQTVVDDILSFAWETDCDPINLGRKAIKLLVEVLVFEDDDHDDEADDRVIDESLATLNFKPASKSSIQSLKRVRLGDDEGLILPFKKRGRFEVNSSSRKQECTICLDDLLDGDEAASMPCGHVYHNGCIVRWLETSRICPLCRYQMPS